MNTKKCLEISPSDQLNLFSKENKETVREEARRRGISRTQVRRERGGF